MENDMKFIRNNKGFTLIELVVATALFGFVAMAVYIVFSTTQNAYSYNTKTVDLRQNLRATLDFMSGEIMGKAGNSGYDMLRNLKGSARTGIETATRGIVTFTSDLDFNGSVERVTYKLAKGFDDDDDGVVNTNVGIGPLVRVTDAGLEEVVTDGVQAIQFAYAFDNNNDKELDFTDANGNAQMDSDEIIWAYDKSNAGLLDTKIDGTSLPENVSFSKIRLVRIWLLGRTASQLKIQEDTRDYTLGGVVISGNNDKYKRFLLSATIKCRNLGL